MTHKNTAGSSVALLDLSNAVASNEQIEQSYNPPFVSKTGLRQPDSGYRISKYGANYIPISARCTDDATSTIASRRSDTVTVTTENCQLNVQKLANSTDECGIARYAKKVTVYIRVVFLKVGEINTLKENYAADVYIQAKWREPHLDGKSQMDTEEINWDEYWTPQLFIENLLGEGKETTWYMVSYDEDQRATVYEKRRVNGNFLEYLELEQFPFDTQDLTITVTTERSETEVELMEDHSEISGINIQSFVDEQEWRLHNHIETWRKITTKVFDNAKFRHPALSAACKATRRPGFFIWNILFVMLFICSLAFTTFTVNIELPQNRLQLSFILLLTTVTFKFVVNQSLPRISYLTYLDKYILTSMTILCLICVWHSIVPHIDNSNNHALIADMIALSILGSTYIFFHIFFFTWIYFNATRKQWKIFRKDQDYKEKMKLMEKTSDKWTAKVEPAYGSFT